MPQKVNYQLDQTTIQHLLTDFLGWARENTYSTELCQFKTSEGKGKDFYRLTPEKGGQSVIIKIFPTADGSMEMTGDTVKRELAFVGSELHSRFCSVVAMPHMATQETAQGYGLLAMQDVTAPLAQIGPGAPLNREKVENLIRTIGKLHSLNWQRHPGVNWLMDFALWVHRGADLLLILAEGVKSLPTWAQAIVQDKPGLQRGMAPFLASMSSGDCQRFLDILRHPELLLGTIADTPKTVCHNDLFFTNLGLENEQILLIDWEFIGFSPAPWDIHCSYAGMPPVGVGEEEMLDLYFSQIPAATSLERTQWLKGYHQMGAIEGIIYGLRALIPAVFDPESRVPAEVKESIRQEILSVTEAIFQAALSK